MLKGGAFFSIECIENYELIRDLTSFGADLVVLFPSEIRFKIIVQIEAMRQVYDVK